jgi:uncharacterized NAD-dependent epimerase/dehydratase family protein
MVADIQTPYLLFLGDAPDLLAAKVAKGIADWRPDNCVGQFRLPACQPDLGLDDLTLEQGIERGAKTLVIGVANRGGIIGEVWIEVLRDALTAGFDLAAGLHNRLTDVPELAQAAERHGRKLFDVRHPTGTFPVGNGVKRSGKRLLTVGTDCSVGKMYTALAIEREMRGRGMAATFRATGQTGILIVGSGVSVDAVVSDFVAGAVETLAPDNADDHWDVIEGQGSLHHASYAGVSLSLLHGAQADALVVCHEPTREHMRGLPQYALPAIDTCIEDNERAARLTNADARVVGISVNTSGLSAGDARDYLDSLAEAHDLPAVDPFRDGVAAIVDNLSAA